jgi:hypothetical protein
MFNIILTEIPVTFLHQDRKVSIEVHMEAQKTLNSQSNPQPKEQCWSYHNT